MKKFVKTLLWIVVLGAVLFGIYTILPEYPHNFIKGFVQPVVNNAADTRIKQIQNMTNKDLDYANYKVILEKNTGMSCWVYEPAIEGSNVETVTYYGKGASINLKEFEDYGGNLSTSCFVKMVFQITGKNVEIIPYIDGKQMYINDGAHKEANDKIKASILKQLYSGLTEE